MSENAEDTTAIDSDPARLEWLEAEMSRLKSLVDEIAKRDYTERTAWAVSEDRPWRVCIIERETGLVVATMENFPWGYGHLSGHTSAMERAKHIVRLHEQSREKGE